jgi:hypothetical protein
MFFFCDPPKSPSDSHHNEIIENLSSAMIQYNTAVARSTTDEELASAYKNLGMASFQMAFNGGMGSGASFAHFLTQGKLALDQAWANGSNGCKSAEWLAGIQAQVADVALQSCLWLRERISDLDERVSVLNLIR